MNNTVGSELIVIKLAYIMTFALEFYIDRGMGFRTLDSICPIGCIIRVESDAFT